jgi:hypothetical protein
LSKLTLPDGAVYDTGDAERARDGASDAPWEGEAVAGQLLKSVDERRYTLSVGYPVNMPDKAKARDGFRDFASATEVEKAAWGYLANSPQVGVYHESGTEGAGTVVESYIWPAPDWTITTPDGGEYTVTKGDWLTGIVWDEAAWAAIQAREINGTSMQGNAARRAPSPADLANLRKR